MKELMQVDGVPKLMRSRRGYKSQITIALESLQSDDNLNKNNFKRQESLIETWISKIDSINNEIDYLCGEENINISELLKKETKYILNVSAELANIEDRVSQNNISNNANLSQISNSNVDALTNAIASFQASSLTPKVHCSKFNGKSNERFAFKNFLVQFKNCTSNMASDSARLTYLRTCLTDFPFQLISHLSINDENYNIALKLLTDEFLDEQYIVDEIFRMLLETSPKYCPEFSDLKSYLIKTKADLFELNTSFDVDLISVNTAGNKLVSHLIYSKLPNNIKKELVRITDTNYPNTDQIFNNCPNIIKTLLKTSNKK